MTNDIFIQIFLFWSLFIIDKFQKAFYRVFIFWFVQFVKIQFKSYFWKRFIDLIIIKKFLRINNFHQVCFSFFSIYFLFYEILNREFFVDNLKTTLNIFYCFLLLIKKKVCNKNRIVLVEIVLLKCFQGNHNRKTSKRKKTNLEWNL